VWVPIEPAPVIKTRIVASKSLRSPFNVQKFKVQRPNPTLSLNLEPLNVPSFVNLQLIKQPRIVEQNLPRQSRRQTFPIDQRINIAAEFIPPPLLRKVGSPEQLEKGTF